MATEAPLPMDTSALDAPAAGDAAPRPAAPKRSWRRKYRKMRVRFDDAMSDSNSLIQQEWKAMGTAKRLQENNDQLLEILLDLNNQTRVHPRLRYDLESRSPAETAAPSHEPAADPDHVKQQLQVLRDDVASGKITAEEYTTQADQLHNSQAIQQTITTLNSLEAKVPHTRRQDLPAQPVDGIDLTETAPGYMDPAHEEEYLLALDQAISEPGFDPAQQLGRPLRLSSAQQPIGDKELTVRNPDSVYNWLRKHQPQVFLQDKDALHREDVSEKSAPKPSGGSKKAKRESAIGGGTPGPRDHDDEDSAAPETGKGRRKTGGDDDTAYRPKGGSSRPAKRKREDGETPAGKTKSKKSRASTAAAV